MCEQSSDSGIRRPASDTDFRTVGELCSIFGPHFSHLQSGRMTSVQSFRENSLAVQTWFWGRGATLLPVEGLLSPAGLGTSLMDAGSFHQMPGLFGLQSYFWTPDTFFFQDKEM